MQKKTKFAIIVFVISVVLVASLSIWCFILVNRTIVLPEYKFEEEEEQSEIFAIIIDAGSTGTRINGFEFLKNGSELILRTELWKEEKPGLSSLTPNEAKLQISKLLHEAENYVPEEFWEKTPLKLKATAGFRLLDPVKSAEILGAVREVFESSKFLTDENSIKIINGSDEGIYSWFSINYFKNLLATDNKVTTLDLGGGSTQVTFEIVDEIPENLIEFSQKAINFGKEIQLFSKSYLGLGLMALRHAVISKNSINGQNYVQSECINANADTFKWKFQNLNYEISPKITDSSTFDDCVTAIRRIVSGLLRPKPPNLQNQTINAFSYFFDRSVDGKLIKKDSHGEEIEVEKFRQKALEYCENKPSKDPWLCLDLTYISVLLQDGYGLRDNKKIQVFSQIDGHEANWTLGSFLQEFMTKNKAKR